MEKFIYYREKLNSLNILIEAIIKLNNKIYKLAIKIHYSNVNSKARLTMDIYIIAINKFKSIHNIIIITV